MDFLTGSRRLIRLSLLAGTLVATCVLSGHAQEMRRPKKLIATGWDKADTGRLLENSEEMEKRPFDGVVLEVVGQDEDGTRVPLR